MNKQLALSFDYDGMTKRDVTACETDAKAICEMELKGLTLIVEQGRRLKAVQERLAHHGDGVFRKWIAAKCPFSYQSAYNRIHVVDTFGGFVKQFDKLPTIEMNAAYLLSRESTPVEAVDEAKQRLSDGKPITYADSKEIIREVVGDDETEDEPEEFDSLIERQKVKDRIWKILDEWPRDHWDDVSFLIEILAAEVKDRWKHES